MDTNDETLRVLGIEMDGSPVSSDQDSGECSWEEEMRRAMGQSTQNSYQRALLKLANLKAEMSVMRDDVKCLARDSEVMDETLKTLCPESRRLTQQMKVMRQEAEMDSYLERMLRTLTEYGEGLKMKVYPVLDGAELLRARAHFWLEKEQRPQPRASVSQPAMGGNRNLNELTKQLSHRNTDVLSTNPL